MRFVTSDWHRRGSVELCDRGLCVRFVHTAIERRAEEVIFAGDILDWQRGGMDAVNEAVGPWFRDAVFGPLDAAGIPIAWTSGNHDDANGDGARIHRALTAMGARRLDVATGPIVRGAFDIRHGHDPFDTWCKTGGIRTHIGEAATRLCGFLEHVGFEAEPEPDPDQIPELFDESTRRAALRWAYGHRRQVVMGHTHYASAVGWPESGWSVVDCGALVQGKPFSFGWIGAGDETAGVEIERSA